MAYEGGQSLPIPLAFPPSSSLLSNALEPLERKTSLSDRQIYVPPLRPAMRSAGSSKSSSMHDMPSPSNSQNPSTSSKHVYSQTPSSTLDPGPLMEDDDGSSESSSGFVAPHLKAMEGARSGDAVGWASMVHR